MIKTRHLIVTAIISFLFFMLAGTPATVVLNLVGDKSIPVTLEGVEGTVWDGSASRIKYSNTHVFENATWSFCLWRLVLGEACVNVVASYRSNDISGQVGINLANNLKFRDINATLDANTLSTIIKLPLGKLSGNLHLDIEHMEWTKEMPPTITGRAIWNNASYELMEKIELGSVRFILYESDNYPLNADLSNNGGYASVAGKANISDDGGYNLELRLQPNSQASPSLINKLGLFAKKQPDGSYLINESGNLKQLGIL